MVPKGCTIEYEKLNKLNNINARILYYEDLNRNNFNDRCVKRRKMRKGETLDVSWDILNLMWSAYPKIWRLNTFSKAFESLF